MVFVIPVGIILAVPINTEERDNRLFVNTGVRGIFFWTWIEVVWLSIWISKLFAKFMPYIFMALCGVVSSGTRKYASIIKAVEIPLSFVLWAVTSLVTFTALTSASINDTPQKNWVNIVKKLLGPALIGCIIFLVEKVLVQMLSISYHKRSFSGGFGIRSRRFIFWDCFGTATPLKLIGKVGHVGDKITSVFGNIASEITGKEVFNPTSAHSIALFADDIAEVLGPSRRKAEECMHFLDNDSNGDISLDEMIMKVVEIGRDRKSIQASMRDVGQAIGVLDNVVCVILFVIVIFIFVAFQNANFVTTLATAGTTLLSLSFVFAASVQEFLGSCIFLFIKHPFDVGDRVDIEGKLLVVEQISLLYTIFKRIDCMKMVQSPNIVLNNLWVENITRSKAMKEQLDMFISFDTSLEDIELLRSEMEAFVRHPDNARDFQPDITLEATGIGNMDKIQLKVEICHKSNWHNETVRAARRSKFMCALVLALRKIPIYAPGGGAVSARAKAATTKEGKRLVPTKKAEPPSETADGNLGSASEAQAADALNSRKPAMDAAHKDGDLDVGERWNAPSSESRTSLDQQRSNDIDNLREGLMQRQSTRGRRRPGESAPSLPEIGTGPGFILTQPSPRGNTFESLREGDEEENVGMNQPTVYQGAPGYDMYPTTSQGGAQQGRQQSQTSRRLSLNFRPQKSTQSGQGGQGLQ
ncbi:Mechanosensitive ion channel-domain-containing protein [Bisporella sp. PMI_857]|nr:Mechanosensitive ion channel-domain-containing protein [Bisporella sp. PMI_857]